MLASVVLEVLKQQPGDARGNHRMLETAIMWFKRSNDMFSQLSDNVLGEMIKWCQLVSIPSDTVVLKQGDPADSFYAVLAGHASAYVITAAPSEDDYGRLGSIMKGQHLSVLDKNKLGVVVKKYAPGGTFGELALLMEDGVRNASVLTDEPCQMLTVARDLYNRLLLDYQKKEFDERLEICNDCPLFSPFAKAHRQKLAMAMEKVHLDFDNVVLVQLQPSSHLYFIVKGHGKVVVDPELHTHQNRLLPYIKSLLTVAIQYQMELKAQKGGTGDVMPLSTATGTDHNEAENYRLISKTDQRIQKARAKATVDLASQKHGLVLKPGVQEVCWVHPGEVVGDVETVLGVENYLWSVVAMEPMEIYVLTQQNFRRIYNMYRNNENAALEIEQKCYARLSERLQRIDTPLCKRLLRHLKLNIEEAAAFAEELARPKTAPPPPVLDWSERLEAFRRRRLKILEKREKLWKPPKPCVDIRAVRSLYDTWQDEVKKEAMMADESNVVAKALTKEEKKAKRLHHWATKINRSKTAVMMRCQEFTDNLEAEEGH